MDALRDLRHGARSLRKSPGLVLVAVLALAIGIGLTTTMFSIVYGVLIKGLPFEGADRVVIIQRNNPERDIDRAGLPIHDVVDFREQQRSFEELAAYYSGTVNVSGSERAERYDGAFVSSNLFRTLNVRPLLGRDFRDGEDGPGAERVAIIGYDMWQTRFGGARDVIGAPIRANGRPYTVIGVMPDGFLFPQNEQIWLPLMLNPLELERGEGSWLRVAARLKPGVSMDQANVELAAISRRLAADHEKTNKGFTAFVVPFVDGDIGPQPRQLLLTMLGAVFLVLLIACANVANLLIDRATHRTKEVGIRTALGASRWSIVRQFLAESLILSLVGALLGVAIAYGGIAAFNRAIVNAEPPFYIDIGLFPPVLAFAAITAFVASLVAGAIPAWQASRTDISEVLKDESRGASSLRIGRLSRALVVFEIALSCGLLVAAGLMIKSVTKLRTIEFGIRTDNIFTARLGFPAGYSDTTAQRRFFESLQQRLSELPGVEAASLTSGLPAINLDGTNFAVEGQTYARDNDYPETRTINVSPEFFETFELPVREGRGIEARDRAESQPVVVVNQEFVKQHFKGESPLGRRIRFGTAESKQPWMTIVGVVPNTHSGDNEEPRPPIAYASLSQNHSNFVSIAVRPSRGDAMSFAPAVRQAVASLDQDIPLYWVYSMKEAVSRPQWFYRVFGTMFMIFGAIALFLAGIGLYAVMAFSVSRRTRELGIRMALGAQGRDVVRLVMRQGAWQLGIGMVVGLLMAVGVSQLLTIVLFETPPRDVTVFASVVVVLILAGFAACFIPARRATAVDPLEALRQE
ncbi:MAG TPA: ABC transporter permease [Gemmatimonadaceae bacterium]|nr:ABC transporter permease [Gemmatimonadaceae bacterium]